MLSQADIGIVSVDVVPLKVDCQSGGNRLLGFSTYGKTDGSSGWAGDVVFGFEGNGYATSVESGYLRVNQLQGFSYGIGTGGALNLEMAANGLDGALGGSAADSFFAGNSFCTARYI